MVRFKLVFLLILWSLFTQCGSLNVADGGSATDIGNAKVSGSLFRTNGLPAGDIQVFLLPVDYNEKNKASYKQEFQTDIKGNFKFINVPEGTYNIEAVDLSANTRVHLSKIEVMTKSIINLHPDTLSPTGFLLVGVKELNLQEGDYLYVPGTRNVVVVNSQMITDSILVIPQLAEMQVVEVILVQKQKLVEIQGTVEIHSGDTSMVNTLPGWLFKKSLTLNTTDSGAGVMLSVENFPLLVRLNKNNFSFSEADSLGRDIRFINDQGVLLPQEVEFWSSDSQTATIWVLVNKIEGNNNTKLTLLWGNLATQNTGIKSNSFSPVFAVTNNFSGVWHMGSDLREVTPNKIVGTLTGAVAGSGIIGLSTQYKGAGDFGQITSSEASPLKFTTQSFSYSMWVKVDSSVGPFDEPLWNGGTNSNSVGYSFLLGTEEWEAKVHNGEEAHIVKFGMEVDLVNRWVYLMAVVNREKNTFQTYLDGKIVGTNNIDTLGTLFNDKDFFIGRDETPFFGWIDEVRVTETARKPEWIKLCYENQKTNQSLVIYD